MGCEVLWEWWITVGEGSERRSGLQMVQRLATDTYLGVYVCWVGGKMLLALAWRWLRTLRKILRTVSGRFEHSLSKQSAKPSIPFHMLSLLAARSTDTRISHMSGPFLHRYT